MPLVMDSCTVSMLLTRARESDRKVLQCWACGSSRDWKTPENITVDTNPFETVHPMAFFM